MAAPTRSPSPSPAPSPSPSLVIKRCLQSILFRINVSLAGKQMAQAAGPWKQFAI